jgi:hypothetical protein
MLSKFIDFKLFFISLAVGIFFVYINQPSPTIIYVYPTPNNIDKIQYKDKGGNCFEFNSKEVTCPKNSSEIHSIPVQEGI